MVRSLAQIIDDSIRGLVSRGGRAYTPGRTGVLNGNFGWNFFRTIHRTCAFV
jgi:hypothetical protein